MNFIDRLKELEAEYLEVWMKLNFELEKELAKEKLQNYEANMLNSYQKERQKIIHSYAAGAITLEVYNKLNKDLMEMYDIKEARGAS
jgi:hypothetical protein